MTTHQYEDRLTPEEEQRLEDIETGKIPMITQTAEEFLKELEELIGDED